MSELLSEAVSEIPVLFYLFAFGWGAIWGSFLNVVVYRWPLLRSVVFPGSTCGACGVALPWYENIPILSCVLQGAACRSCGSRFSWRYSLVEALMACCSLAIWIYSKGDFLVWQQGFFLVFVCLAVFLTDLDHWIIPDELNLTGVVLGLIFTMSVGFRSNHFGESILDGLVGCVVGYAFFLLIQVLGLLFAKQEAMGGGDVKFAAALGAFLGWWLALKSFFLAFLLGAVVAIPLMVTRRAGSKEPIPFGTFMAVAAVIVHFFPVTLETIFERISWIGF